MPSPFPGMDPYLEDPRRWPDFHARMITGLAAALGPLIRPDYFVEIEARLVLYQPDEDQFQSIAPDVLTRTATAEGPAASGGPAVTTPAAELAEAVTVLLPQAEQRSERWLEIRRSDSEQVVTVIELLSPWNKQAGDGARDYDKKRQTVLDSEIHLIEIDLLRHGRRPPLQPAPPRPPAEYYVLVSRAEQRPQCTLVPIRLKQALPPVTVPLLPPDPDVSVSLQDVFNRVYDEAGYDLVLRYESDPVPPLPKTLAEWADALLREKKLRKPRV